ncbi:glycosyl transferase family 2 [Nonlabens sp. YIK11]|uniref:glycosyltransferase family 2 protein n=1 Tax=Nonlabens sp. YIK11 TaxID=1453349 RepID=UPI0006DC0BF3|nr:glycosyltransferase family A protein [Nonlabens sp. YIK11]KQC34142.1 glycosyl transferase family 2 [Nonlabens sp. YIK11]
MEKKLVSIIVPCYNQAHFLSESLGSVLEQIYTDWECIIVNDGSQDHTEAVAQQWINKDPRFKYVYKHNGGLSSARNTGIKASKGQLILPLDADDVLHPVYLSKLVPLLIENKKLAIISCYTGFFKSKPSNTYFILEPKGADIKNMLYLNQLVATSIYRKSDWEQVGGYDEQMKTGFEDWEFWLRILKATGKSYHIVPEVLFYYRKAKQSMLVNTVSNHQESIKKYIIQKHPELYIADFKNFTSVQFHHLMTAREKEKSIKNSAEFKLGRLLLKPYRWLTSLVARNNTSKKD